MENGGDSKVSKCQVCEGPADKHCSGCHGVFYCSVEHQTSDWKKHKLNCSPITIVVNDQLGRHYVAARNLKAGTIVLTERPILVHPGLIVDSGRPLSSPACLGCCSESLGRKCRKCYWPICSDTCSNYKDHAQFECKLFQELESVLVNNTFRSSQVMSTAVAIIRGIILKKNYSDKWSKVEKLLQGKDFNCLSRSFEKAFFEQVFPMMKKFGLSPEFYKIDDIKMILLALEHGTDCISVTYQSSSHVTKAHVVLPGSKLFSHACFPNCSSGTGPGPEFTRKVWTTIDIKKGQVLSKTYDSKVSKMGAGYLHQNKGKLLSFSCTCPRCESPSECDTFLSAISHLECSKNGYFLPQDHKNHHGKWICNGCSTSVEDPSFLKDVTKIKMEIESFFDWSFVEDFAKKIEGKKILHPNHWLRLRLMDRIAEYCNGNLSRGGVKIEKSKFYANCFGKIVDMEELIYPGLNASKCFTLNLICNLMKLIIMNDEDEDDDDCACNEVQLKTNLIRDLKRYLTILVKIQKLNPQFENFINPQGQLAGVNLQLEANLKTFTQIYERNEEFEEMKRLSLN